jgi:hypothetical protein
MGCGVLGCGGVYPPLSTQPCLALPGALVYLDILLLVFSSQVPRDPLRSNPGTPVCRYRVYCCNTLPQTPGQL